MAATSATIRATGISLARKTVSARRSMSSRRPAKARRGSTRQNSRQRQNAHRSRNVSRNRRASAARERGMPMRKTFGGRFVVLAAPLASLVLAGHARADTVEPGKDGKLSEILAPIPGERACFGNTYDAA